jgi:hypothetical protein
VAMKFIAVSSEHSPVRMPKPVSAATETVKACMVNSRLQRRHRDIISYEIPYVIRLL